MKNYLLLIVLSIFIFFSQVHAQQTVGLFLNSENSYNGYTLFAPQGHETTYLIDNCGLVVKTWESDYAPGSVVYLLENGSLLRTARVSSPIFNGGGIGGRIEMFNWDGDLIWVLDYASDEYHQHHDIEYLPNGNILVLAWEYKSAAESAAAGRSSGIALWPTQVVEVEPMGSEGGNIVWSWHLWDHTVQDIDPSLPNYGIIAEHPELVNINYTNPLGGGIGADWAHCNAVAYNADLDQIIINSRNFNEFWIIDHSTTTEEAASHSGGNMGKGGDILYRWGNPDTYNRGNAADQRLFVQHDAYWIPSNSQDGGSIMVYNNGTNRPEGDYSTVDVITPPVNEDGSYVIADGMAFGPNELTWNYTAAIPSSFYSQNISGANRLANGNTLICEGRPGRIFEVDYEGNTVWQYVSPVSNLGPVSQGTVVNSNSVFRAYRYAPDFPAFDGKDLVAGNPIEFDPLPLDCQIYEAVDSTVVGFPSINVALANNISLYPNPSRYQCTISVAHAYSANNYQIAIFDITGKHIFNTNFTGSITINTETWVSGIYTIKIIDVQHNAFTTKKLVQY